MRSLLDVQHRDSLRRILMEGGQGLCRGWLVCTRFQVKMYASEIADTRGKRKTVSVGYSPTSFSVSATSRTGGWLRAARMITSNR